MVYRYGAEYLLHQTGTLVKDDSASQGYAWHVAGDAPPGALCYGPYEIFPPGRYQAAFRLRIGKPSEKGPVAQIDVAAEEGNVLLASDEVSASDFSLPGRYQEFNLRFMNPITQALEFRTFFPGRMDLWLDSIAVSPSD